MNEQKFKITRVGAEPVVMWDRDEESDLPRFILMMPGWEFRGPGNSWITLGDGGGITGTVLAVGDQPLVPSDPEPDIENGWIQFGVVNNVGYTIADLRTIARTETGWRRFRRWIKRLWLGRLPDVPDKIGEVRRDDK